MYKTKVIDKQPPEDFIIYFLIGGIVVDHTTNDIDAIEHLMNKPRSSVGRNCVCTFNNVDREKPYYAVSKNGWDVNVYDTNSLYVYDDLPEEFENYVMSIAVPANEKVEHGDISIVKAKYMGEELFSQTLGVIYKNKPSLLPLVDEYTDEDTYVEESSRKREIIVKTSNKILAIEHQKSCYDCKKTSKYILKFTQVSFKEPSVN